MRAFFLCGQGSVSPGAAAECIASGPAAGQQAVGRLALSRRTTAPAVLRRFKFLRIPPKHPPPIVYWATWAAMGFPPPFPWIYPVGTDPAPTSGIPGVSRLYRFAAPHLSTYFFPRCAHHCASQQAAVPFQATILESNEHIASHSTLCQEPC